MPTYPEEPRAQDVLIQHESSGHFAVGSWGGALQLECADFEEALARGGQFAARERADLWYVGGDGCRRHLADVFSLRRLWNEYVDLPGLRLTLEQIERLMNVDAATCESVLAAMVELGLLRKAADGTYARAAVRHRSIPPLRIKKAGAEASRRGRPEEPCR